KPLLPMHPDAVEAVGIPLARFFILTLNRVFVVQVLVAHWMTSTGETRRRMRRLGRSMYGSYALAAASSASLLSGHHRSSSVTSSQAASQPSADRIWKLYSQVSSPSAWA